MPGARSYCVVTLIFAFDFVIRSIRLFSAFISRHARRLLHERARGEGRDVREAPREADRDFGRGPKSRVVISQRS